VTHFDLQGLKKEEGHAKYEYNVTQGHLVHFVAKNLEELKRMQAVVEEEEDAMKFIPLGKDFHYHY
jgi:hypothetical protein